MAIISMAADEEAMVEEDATVKEVDVEEEDVMVGDSNNINSMVPHLQHNNLEVPFHSMELSHLHPPSKSQHNRATKPQLSTSTIGTFAASVDGMCPAGTSVQRALTSMRIRTTMMPLIATMRKLGWTGDGPSAKSRCTKSFYRRTRALIRPDR